MRSLKGEEMYVCADEATVSGLGQAAPDIYVDVPSAFPRKRGRPKGSYGKRRGCYIDPETGAKDCAEPPKMAAGKCRIGDPVYWDYNDNPDSKFGPDPRTGRPGQFRCRCAKVTKDGVNSNYVPNEFCEIARVEKSPAESERVRNKLDAASSRLAPRMKEIRRARARQRRRRK
jgi:hypothetical protein